MVDAFIADEDMVLMEPWKEMSSLKNGTIVSAMVPGSGTTLKYFFKKSREVTLAAANPNYEDIKLDCEKVIIQRKSLAVWEKYNFIL